MTDTPPVLWYAGNEVRSMGAFPSREIAENAGRKYGIEGVFSKPAGICRRCRQMDSLDMLSMGVCISCDHMEDDAREAQRDEERMRRGERDEEEASQ